MPEEITQLLMNWSNGDQSAVNRLMPLVYDELHRLAASYLRRERQGHSLQPTALVHEAYLRLIDQQSVTWQNRAQFFGLAAAIMRNILVDHVRRRRAARRGGNEVTLTISHADRLGARSDIGLLALDDALNDLAAIRPRHARIVELKFFGGLTIDETAEVLGISHATVERDWTFARAWLKRELSN
ncbi:MAG: sigma-70 family RNA polymerase sigma factor [Blastocatellia bacterium]